MQEKPLQVCDKFGVNENEVHNALLSGDPHDQLAIAYHLIIDNKRIADEAAKAEIKDFYVAGSPPPVSMSSPSPYSSSPLKPHPERIAPPRDRLGSASSHAGSITGGIGTPGERGTTGRGCNLPTTNMIVGNVNTEGMIDA